MLIVRLRFFVMKIKINVKKMHDRYNGVHQLEFSPVVHIGVAVNVASSMYHVDGVDECEVGDIVMGEAVWVWSAAVACSSH